MFIGIVESGRVERGSRDEIELDKVTIIAERITQQKDNRVKEPNR